MKTCLSIAGLLFISSSLPVLGCATCMGDPNSQLAVASDATLWMLLALVGFIFVSTAATAWYLYRHASKSMQKSDPLLNPNV